MKRLTALATSMAIATMLAACTTAPSGRQQLLLLSDTQLNELGAQTFDEIKRTQPLSTNAQHRRYAECVVNALVAELPAQWAQLPWEVQVFADASPNAFALPGGKVGVNAGMFSLAENQSQLAAVIGHEIGHVVFRHANERVSRSQLVGAGVQAGGAIIGSQTSPEAARTAAGLLGAGAQVGLMLPFSREQEREVDIYGQDIMTQAGFDPSQAAALWQNMIRASGGASQAAFLSTHPDPSARAQRLAERAPALQGNYERARQSGRNPRCG